MRKTDYFDNIINTDVFVGERATAANNWALRSGGSEYTHAFVANPYPLVLISPAGDMVWSATVTREKINTNGPENESLYFREALEYRFSKIDNDGCPVKSEEYDWRAPVLLADYFYSPTSRKVSKSLYAEWSLNSDSDFISVSMLVEPPLQWRANFGLRKVRGQLYRTAYDSTWLLIVRPGQGERADQSDSHYALLLTEGRRWAVHVDYSEAVKSLQREEAAIAE